MSNFHVGQKVCLARQFSQGELSRAAVDSVALPVKGMVYTIRAFDDQTSVGGGLGLWICEVVNPPHWTNGIEPSFWVDLFEPVVERKTDISIFTDILKTSKQKVPA